MKKVKLFKTCSGLDDSFKNLEQEINEFITGRTVYSVEVSFAAHASNCHPSGGGHYIATIMYEEFG